MTIVELLLLLVLLWASCDAWSNAKYEFRSKDAPREVDSEPPNSD